MKAATISDVARMAGVSVSTVSRYLNRSGYVSSDVAHRVSEAVKKLNYVPSHFARVLRDSRTKQIAMVVPDITNPYYALAYSATQEFAGKHGYTVLLFSTTKTADSEINSLNICREMMVEGIIFYTEKESSFILERLVDLAVPVVINVRSDPPIFDMVLSERGYGIYMATKHLCELGHKRIAYSGGPANSHINQVREKAFEKALTETGLKSDKDYIFEMAFTTDSGYKSGLFFGSLRIPPTAIVAANDIIALGVMIALNELGKRIPEDISLTGEDNIDFTKVCRPNLTTVENDPILLSETACGFLFDRILGGFDGEPRLHICPRKLIIRDSTAPPSPADS